MSRAVHGRALEAWWRGQRDAELMVHSSLGEHDPLPVSVFFRSTGELFPFERAALPLCRGRVLDVGAGTGVHALALQAQDFDVVAIDVVEEAVAIMRARGVRDARLVAVEDLQEKPFDTVLSMMNGTGPAGTLDGLRRFLGHFRRLMAADGQVLIDSSAPWTSDDAAPEGWVAPWPTSTGYFGESWIQLEFDGDRGEPFRELYVDLETFRRAVEDDGWVVQPVFQDDHGEWTARLVLA